MANNEQKHIVSDKMTAPSTTTPCNKWLSTAIISVRIIIGCVFIFSGIVKLIDPWGTAYKIEDYLMVANLRIMSPLPLITSIALSLAELLIGVNTLLGSYFRSNPLLLLIFMIFMTPLTLFLAVVNPIPDCGCFGDALHLSNWQTFAKNVVLLSGAIFLYRYNHCVKSVFHREFQAFTIIWSIIYATIIVWIALAYMPILDFRPFKTGTDLAAAYYGEGTPDIEYDFIYQRNGQQATFTIDNLPNQEEGWQFVERKQRSGTSAQSAHNILLEHFTIYDGNDEMTEEILDRSGFSFIMFSQDLNTANDNHVNKLNELHDYCKEYGYPFYAVTASSPQEIDEWLDNTGGEYTFMFMDKTTIRTIARNNPFVLILRDGNIYYKCPISQLPDETELTTVFEEVEKCQPSQQFTPRQATAFVITLLVLPIIILYIGERLLLTMLRQYRKSKNKKNEQTINN